MRHRYARCLLAPALAAACLLTASASTPVFWQVSTRAEFMKGEAENLALDNDGRLSLGPASALVHDTASPFVWSLIAAAGGDVYAGTGNDGKVFRIGPDGKGAVFFDAAELEVHAVTAAPGGGLYVATSPDGRIYKVDDQGRASPFYDPDDKYIWSLAVGPGGDLYVATGERGIIHRVAPDGKGEVFYRTKATNVMSLAFDAGGNLLAATAAPGRVFRIDSKGKGFVLLDSPYREVRSLRLREDGSIFAAAVAGSEPGAASSTGEAAIAAPLPKSTPVPTVTTEVTSITILDVGAAETDKPTPRVTPRVAKGAVYRIGPDGVWDVIWESQEDTPYDVAFEERNGILIATGSKGKVYRVAGDPPQVSLVASAGGQQVTRFLRTARGETWYATSNPGKIFRFTSSRAESGWFESEVRDATTVSSWGTISWRASVPEGTRVELRTRSGNSEPPDETWSAWSEAYADAGGEQIRSPKARYLQWKATLSGKGQSPVLTSVTAAYLQRNLRPRVTGITVYPAGIVFQKPFSTGETEIAGFEEGWPDTRPSPTALAAGATSSPMQGPALGRRTYQKGLQAFTWKAEDDNEDKLQYDVLYRRETDAAWKTIRRGIADQLFVWDTTSVPNGTYVLRIVASDAASNPPGAALAGEADSVSFDVDNTPPAIRVSAVRKQGDASVIAFEVRDDHAAVQRVDFSSDGTRWRPIYPLDGICDSPAERFELVVDGDPGNVVIRAVDAMSNVATARPNGAVK
jgi:hypothetical protein